MWPQPACNPRHAARGSNVIASFTKCTDCARTVERVFPQMVYLAVSINPWTPPASLSAQICRPMLPCLGRSWHVARFYRNPTLFFVNTWIVQWELYMSKCLGISLVQSADPDRCRIRSAISRPCRERVLATRSHQRRQRLNHRVKRLPAASHLLPLRPPNRPRSASRPRSAADHTGWLSVLQLRPRLSRLPARSPGGKCQETAQVLAMRGDEQ